MFLTPDKLSAHIGECVHFDAKWYVLVSAAPRESRDDETVLHLKAPGDALDERWSSIPNTSPLLCSLSAPVAEGMCACGKRAYSRGVCCACYYVLRRAVVARTPCLPGRQNHSWTAKHKCVECGITR